MVASDFHLKLLLTSIAEAIPAIQLTLVVIWGGETTASVCCEIECTFNARCVGFEA